LECSFIYNIKNEIGIEVDVDYYEEGLDVNVFYSSDETNTKNELLLGNHKFF